MDKLVKFNLIIIIIACLLCSICALIISRLYKCNNFIHLINNNKIINKPKISKKHNDIHPDPHFNILKNILVVLSSSKRSMVMINNKIVIDGGNRGLTFILINRNNYLDIKMLMTFDIGVSCKDLENMLNFIDQIGDEIVVVVSRGETFNLFFYNSRPHVVDQAIDALRSLGSKNRYFTDRTNYILIGSKNKDAYFERASVDDVYFPEIEMVENICRINTAYLQPPHKYYFYRDFSNTDDHKIRCALEASRKGMNSFGIGRDICVIMNDNDWDDFKQSKISNRCEEGLGNFNSISGYRFNKIFDGKKYYLDKQHGISLFSNSNFSGKTTVLGEGEYTYDHIPFKINSVIVPKDYVIYFVYNEDGHVDPIFGEKKTQVNSNNLSMVVIKKILSNSVFFCDTEDGNGNSRCYVYGPGKHALPHFFYWNIKSIKASPEVQEVILYQDSGFLDKIANFDIDPNNLHHVIKHPRIVRSIRIK